jgi:hypothetical protein
MWTRGLSENGGWGAAGGEQELRSTSRTPESSDTLQVSALPSLLALTRLTSTLLRTHF